MDGPTLGRLLTATGVPVLVLNACRSAYTEAPSRPGEPDASPVAGHRIGRGGEGAGERRRAGGCACADPGVRVAGRRGRRRRGARGGGDAVQRLRRHRRPVRGGPVRPPAGRARPSAGRPPRPGGPWPTTRPGRSARSRSRCRTGPSRSSTRPPRSPSSSPSSGEAPLIHLTPGGDRADGAAAGAAGGCRGRRMRGSSAGMRPCWPWTGRSTPSPVVLLHAFAGAGKTTTAAEFARWYAATGGLHHPDTGHRAGAVVLLRAPPAPGPAAGRRRGRVRPAAGGQRHPLAGHHRPGPAAGPGAAAPGAGAGAVGVGQHRAGHRVPPRHPQRLDPATSKTRSPAFLRDLAQQTKSAPSSTSPTYCTTRKTPTACLSFRKPSPSPSASRTQPRKACSPPAWATPT